MRTFYISVLVLFFSVNLHSQTVSQVELKQFYEKQQTPFLENSAEIFVINDIGWLRPYGENEFALTPIITDYPQYYSRITSLDNSALEIYKSAFSYVKVGINSFSKSLLQEIGIDVPTYVQNELIVYLPQIDIDRLLQEGINCIYLPNYGKQEPTKLNVSQNKVNLYYESFEANTVPGSNFVISNTGAANCGWKDVNCVTKSGNWSLYCAGNGAACNPTCSNTNHVNNMNSAFANYPPINTSGYVNLIFSFWMNFDLENSTGVTDYCNVSFDFGSGFQMAGTYNSQSSGNGTGNYVQKGFTISGFPNSITYSFRMVSDGSFTNMGVYLDDILLTGDINTTINENDLTNAISIYPNPTNGIFSIEADNMESIEITSITGEIVKELVINNNITTIDLTSFSSGIYFAKIVTNKGSVIKKIVLE
tara:strand:- start:47837 stop:49099 length:1263 start_codon:yes stop_codon:yes gene_type:complete